MENFEVLSEIGKGGYGTVVKARDKRSNRVVALKRVELADDEEGVKNSALREVALIKRCDHPNVVKIYSLDVAEHALLIGYELYPTDLRSFMKKHVFREEQIKIVMRYSLESVKYIHDLHIVHRDFKPHNLLFDPQDLSIKLIDFGLSRQINYCKQPFSPNAGTKFFFAPEMMLGKDDYDGKVDIWGCGLLLSQLFIGQYAFPCKTNSEGLIKIFQVFGSYSTELKQELEGYGQWRSEYDGFSRADARSLMKGSSDEAYDLFLHLCDINWKTRYTAAQALQHRWFKDVTVE